MILSLCNGDWRFGNGDWGLGTIPNPQYPTPNPQSPLFLILFKIKELIKLFK
jgi:hypothetical protein